MINLRKSIIFSLFPLLTFFHSNAQHVVIGDQFNNLRNYWNQYSQPSKPITFLHPSYSASRLWPKRQIEIDTNQYKSNALTNVSHLNSHNEWSQDVPLTLKSFSRSFCTKN